MVEAREGRRLGSVYLQADAAHTRSDIYVTLGVVASFAGARAGVPWVDGVVALAIAAFIAVLGVRILVGSFHTLTDRAVIAPDKLSAVVCSVPGVRHCREVRTTRRGRRSVRGHHHHVDSSSRCVRPTTWGGSKRRSSARIRDGDVVGTSSPRWGAHGRVYGDLAQRALRA